MSILEIYSSEHDGKDFKRENLKKLTGLDLNAWLRITGFFDGNLKGFISPNEFKISGFYPTLIIECEKIILAMRINLEHREIHNASIILEGEYKHQGRGTEAHHNQISVARKLGFTKLTILAVGDDDTRDDWQGRIAFAKFGYTLSPKSQSDFEAKMKSWDTPEKCLHRYIWHKKNEEQWRRNGLDWNGEFILEENSINMRLFKKFNKKRNKIRLP